MVKFIQKACFVLLLFFALPFKGLCQTPFPKWVDDFGGSGYAKATDMVVDKQNNIYVTGYFSGTIDFDPSSGVKNLTSVGNIDIFIGKYSQTGTLIWAESMGGDALDQPNNLAVDKDGNVSIAGQFESSNLDADPGPGVYTLSSQGGDDIFVIHLDTNGNFLWAKTVGGAGTERGEEVSVDSQDNVITSSIFSSPITVGSSTYTPTGGGFYGLIVKYSSAGTVLWSVSIGNNGDNGAFGDRVDSNDNIVISGVFTNQVNFNPLGTAVNLTAHNPDAPFVAKYSPSGALVWADAVSGTLEFEQSVVSIDPQNNIYFTGAFYSPLTFNGTTTINPKGSQDILLSKFSANGALLFAKSMGGAGGVGYNYEVACDRSSNVYLEGYFGGTINFNPNSGTAANVTYHGQQDFYLAKYDANGNYIYAFGIGSANCSSTFGKGLAIDNNNFADVAGEFCSTVNFDPTGCTTDDLTAVSSTSDGFVAQYVPATLQVIANNTITAPAVTNFCGTGSPATITGSTPTGSSNAYTYQWQSSPDSVTFTSITGATAINYTPTTLNTTTYFRRIVSSGNCATPSKSNIIGIKVQNALSNNTITAPQVQSFCVNGSPAAITGSTPTGGNGTFTYQWQNSTDNVNFTNITGATAVNYTPPALTVTTWYRRLITSGVCTTPAVSNIVEILIYPVVANNAITSPAVTTFCTGGMPAPITGSTPTGGDSTYTYQWQLSTDKVTFANIGGATAINYQPGTLDVTSYFRRMVTSGVCNTPLASNVVAIQITNPPAAPVVPSVSICPGTTATLSVSSPVDTLKYNWYSSITKTNLLFTGTSYTTDTIRVATTFYVVAQGSMCTSIATTEVAVNINATPTSPAVVNAQVTICNGTTATLNISEPQDGLSYHWYAVAAGGTAVGSGTSFTTPALTASATYYAEAANSTGCVSSPRTEVKIAVTSAPLATTVGASICPGSSATLSATSTDGSAVINWYSSATGGEVLAVGNNFTTPELNANTTYYAETVDNATGCISATRAPAAVTLLKPLSAPVVTVGSTTISSITFEWDAVTGATGYQVSIDGGKTFSAPSSGGDGLSDIVTGLQGGQSVTIIVRATGSEGCEISESSDAITGTTPAPLDDVVYVPNAFTPNGDGKNDQVHVHGESIKTMTFKVYDQWGELIFTSTDIQNGWDGTYKGTREPNGVYVYYLQATMNDGKLINKNGLINLIR